MENPKSFISLQFSELNCMDIMKNNNTFQSAECYMSTVYSKYHCDIANPNYNKVEKINYEADEQEVIKDLHIICDNAHSKWNIDRIAIYHRLGEVSIKELSIIIVIFPYIHQQSDAIGFMQFVSNAVKSLNSISKKEIHKSNEINYSYNDKESNLNFNHKESGTKDKIFENDSRQKTSNMYQKTNGYGINNKFHPDNLHSFSSLEDETVKSKKLWDYECNKRNKTNMQKNCIIRQIQNNHDETMVCARANIIYSCSNKVRRAYNHWNDPHFKKSNPLNFKLEPSVSDDTLPSIKIVSRDVHEKVKNLESRLFSLLNKDSRYLECLRIEKSPVDERLSSIEDIIGIDKLKNVHERLEVAEERLLYLESCAPEYFFYPKNEQSKPEIKLDNNETCSMKENENIETD